MAAFLGSRAAWICSPLEEAAVALADDRISDSESVFRVFRRSAISASAAEIEANVVHAATVWMFLLEFCAKRKIYRLQALEVVNALFECKAWEDAFGGNKDF